MPETIHGTVERVYFASPTFSAGVAPYHPGENAESYMARADAALYQAKRQGRDRIEVFDGSQESSGPGGDGSGRDRRNCS